MIDEERLAEELLENMTEEERRVFLEADKMTLEGCHLDEVLTFVVQELKENKPLLEAVIILTREVRKRETQSSRDPKDN